MDFMHRYIDQNRFGEFVENILESERKRKHDAAEKENEDKLWDIYVRVLPDKSFNEWKADLQKAPETNDKMSDKQISDIVAQSRKVLEEFQ